MKQEDPTPAQVAPGFSPCRDEQQWSVGTLTYTRRNLGKLFGWLLWGDFAWSLRDRGLWPVIQLLLKKFGASDSFMAIFMTSLPAALGMVLGPVISYNSDRHRGPRGRRIPFILWTTPVAALAMVGLAYSQVIAGHLQGWWGVGSLNVTTTTLLIFGLLWIVFEFAALTSGAVFGGLINDVVPVPLLGRFFGLFRAFSLLAGIVFNYWLIGAAEDHFKWLFIGIAAVYGVGVLSMCLKVREGAYPPPPDVTPGSRRGFFASVKVYARECFSKPHYLWIFIALAVANLSFLPVNLYSVLFAKSIGVDMALYGKFLAITYVISLGLSYVLGSLADRFHPLRMGIASLALYASVMLVGGVMPATPRVFAVVLIIHGVASGTYFTTTASIGQRLFPRATFAQFASASGVLVSIVNMCISPIFGVILDRSNHHYHYTFGMSGGIALLALGLFLVVYRRFMALGGPSGYVAPE